MGLMDLIEKAINEHGSAAIQKERIEWVKEQITALEKKNGELETKNEQLVSENATLRAQLATAKKADEFEEHYGAAFKRKPDGSFHHGIYCPIHHLPASSIDSDFPYSCPQKGCGWASDITPGTLGQVIQKITPGTLSNTLRGIID